MARSRITKRAGCLQEHRASYVVKSLLVKAMESRTLPACRADRRNQSVVSIGNRIPGNIWILFEAKERNVASIQEYMNKRDEERVVEVKIMMSSSINY